MTALDEIGLRKIEQTISAAARRAETILIGRRARLIVARNSKHLGREGQISNVMISGDFRLIACFYVYKTGTTEFLNSECWTRQYRPLSHLELLPEETTP